MSNFDITDSKNILTKICSILLTVIFFILSFLTGFNNLVVFGLGLLTIALVILLSYRSIKNVSLYTLGILLIPLLAYGVIMSLSLFSKTYYSLSTRIFLTFNILLFAVSGYFSKNIKGFDFKWAFRGIFIGLSIICLINLVSTSVYYGPFYGISIPYYYSYYDGVASRVSVSGTAYALCGLEVKEVPIEYYLIYPFLLLTTIPCFLLGKKKDKRSMVINGCFALVAFISLLFVISKITLIYIVLYLIVLGLISSLIVFRKVYNKVFKNCLYVLLGIVVVFALTFFINSQYTATGFREFIASSGLLNYLYNTNRYSSNLRAILNGVFTQDKLIGFPTYYDYDFLLVCYPSNNIIVNQFMYGGVFGFLFFDVIIALFVYLFKELRKENLEDKEYKYFPALFVIFYFVISLLIDQNSYDVHNYDLIFASYLSPFFYFALFVIGHYFALVNTEEEKDEK